MEEKACEGDDGPIGEERGACNRDKPVEGLSSTSLFPSDMIVR
jgi:hypothetical protein